MDDLKATAVQAGLVLPKDWTVRGITCTWNESEERASWRLLWRHDGIYGAISGASLTDLAEMLVETASRQRRR